jgi:hypothetical protein
MLAFGIKSARPAVTRAAVAMRSFSWKPPKNDEANDVKRRPPVLAKTKLKPNVRHSKTETEITSRTLRKRHNAKPDCSAKMNHSSSVQLLSPLPPTDYIPFNKFPQAPESIMKSSLQDLYGIIGTKPETETSKKSSFKESENFVDFNIPDKFLKSQIKQQITDKDRAMVEELDNFLKTEDEAELAQSQLKLIKLYYDQDTNSFQPLPEHALKKTLSGMLNLNPSLDDIGDEYLWKLFPKDKIFGSPPFEPKIIPNGFKNWEQEKLLELEKEKSARENNVKEFKEFEKQLTNSKSFFKKAGSRKKLDRKLVKQYKKLKLEGKIPKDLSGIDKDDDDDLL